MAQLVGGEEIESLRFELSEILRNNRNMSSFDIDNDVINDDHNQSQWRAIERLPTSARVISALFDDDLNKENDNKRIVNVTKLGAQERQIFIEKLIKHVEDDNLRLLQKLKKRIDNVGVKLPTIEVRYEKLRVEAECKIVRGKSLPTLWNTIKDLVLKITGLSTLEAQNAKIGILKDVNGVIKPGRMTLLLGPPGCGKTTFLMALAGKLSDTLKVGGEISYNGYKLGEFVPQKTSAYVSQHDLHIPELTVRETLNFSAHCQGVGSRADIMMEVSRREKQAGIIPDPDVDAYMKAVSAEGVRSNLQTDYTLKILGLDICADTMVGDPMRRGISGGQKKRLTTGEMIVGPAKALFMDEISNGLDTSTTHQIISCIQHLVHLSEATAVISLLQPAPETFDLFDDVILMDEGKIVYHGPRSYVLNFFDECGFKCPERKGAADFLQEVISRKDQAQYWKETEKKPYKYFSVDDFVERFRECRFGRRLEEQLSQAFDKSGSHEDALCFENYSLPKWELLQVCARREFLLMKRNSFIYVFKSIQLVIIASITMTVFIRTRMAVDLIHANYYMGSLFYGLVIIFVDGFPEIALTASRMIALNKQLGLHFYPAWAFSIPTAILKLPLSLLESFVWTALTYYVIGYSPEISRFFKQFLLFFFMHVTSISMFRFVAAVSRTVVISMTTGSLAIMVVLLFGGFIIPKSSMPVWLSWGYWICPLAYGEIGVTVNEFLAPRWQKTSSTNTTLGLETLESRGLNYESYFYWISIGALIGFTILYNVGFTLALTFLKPPGRSRARMSRERYAQLHGQKDNNGIDTKVKKSFKSSAPATELKSKGRMVLPFEPLTLTFEDVQYYVDTPVEMRQRGFEEKKLQLLSDVTGAFRPGVLTALMGISGAGKTTLMDVLCGRKTGGTIEGEIRIGGYPKVQQTFARISGYCEQNDIHSPNITVEESVKFSAWLRLDSQIDSATKIAFVKEVLETIELDVIKDSLVGMPGVSGLSTEQRKRLTIAVELVSNPSIIFMDEPTSGLDARAAAIVMRAVKNVVETGRTIVCTIHQPSIDIFEAFDELILMKSGGRMIYSGPLGKHSRRVIEYFESIAGVQKIKDNYNPATWMLEVTSKSTEADLGIDFAHIYKTSVLHEQNKDLVKQLTPPIPGSKDLRFRTRFPQGGFGQFKACLWKQHLSYWRSPSYNLMRFLFISLSSLLFGVLFWNQGKRIENQQDIFNIQGAMFLAIIFFGINNCATVQPSVAIARNVLYRERFAGMYSSWAYSFAQVVIEVPYLLMQAIIFVIITYPMIGYYWSFYKVFWSFYSMFCSLMCFNYIGMLLVSLTPNLQMASILASTSYTMLNLFAGYMVPKPHIPKWWIWLYYISPTSWALNGMLTSQYGDIEETMSAFGESKPVSAFLKDYFGYDHNLLGAVGGVLIVFPFVLACMFAYFIGKLNFQKR